MTRTFATATAIATALIAISPAADAGQMINGPTPQVNVVPNVPRPQTNLSAVTPSPEVRRVLKQGEAEDDSGNDDSGNDDSGNDDSGNGDRAGADDQPENTGEVAEQPPRNQRTEALTDRAPVPPAFPATLVKAMDVPPLNPGSEGEPMPLPWPREDDDADDGHADHLGDAGETDTDGSDGDAPGTGDAPPLGENDAEGLREQFQGGIGVERAEEIARLKELQENGWLEFGDGAFAGDGDCGPGVNLPAGTDLHGLGCDGGAPETDSRPDRDKGPLGGMPLDPDRGHGGYPRPSPDDGMGGNGEHDNAWIDGGGSAKGNSGVIIVGQGQASADTTETTEDSQGSTWRRTASDSSGTTTWSVYRRKDGSKAAVSRDDMNADGSASNATIIYDEDGDATHEYYQSTDATGNRTTIVVDHENETVTKSESEGGSSMSFETEVDYDDFTSGGGEAGQPDPRGPQTGGGAGGDCLMLGTRCDVAEGESGETWGEKMKEWARSSGLGSGGLTPGKVMEQAGQPVPVPGRDSATGEVADPRTEAGLTPGCDAGPGGCAGGGDGGIAGSEAAGAAADDALDDASVDGSIAGMTPGCDASPDGCGGSTGAAAEAGVESGAGEAAR